jgi:hypothetical protein
MGNLAWPFSPDQTIALVGTFAAIVAALYAFRADRFVRRTSATAEARRDREIQPRLSASSQFGVPDVWFENVGGAATNFIWLGTDDEALFAAWGTISANTQGMVVFRRHEMGLIGYKTGLGTLALVAEDLQGRWWDCRTDLRLPGSVTDYLKKRLDQCGMSHLHDNVINTCVPRRLPPEATNL